MKLMHKKNLFAILPLLAVLGHPGRVSAHVVVGSLLKPEEARDVHRISCPDAGARLELQVRDNAPVKPPVINLLVEKDGLSASARDKKDGDAKASPLIVLQAGGGDYTVTVYKTAAKPKKKRHKEIYTLIYHCMVGNRHTDTTRVYISNQ